jgi:hypothetical protein
MTRTDIHRPSAVRPEDYELVGFKYVGPDEFGPLVDDRAHIARHMQQTGGKYSGHEHGGTCHVCGAWAHTLGVFRHIPTNVYIETGEDCAEKMNLGEGIAFRSFKKRIAAGREAAAGKAKAQKILAEHDLGAAWDVYTGTATGKQEAIITDIVGNVVRYGSLTEKQAAFLHKLLADLQDRPRIEAERAARDALSQHVGTVGSRAEFTATVTFKTSYESQFGLTFVTGFVDDAGNVLIAKGQSLPPERGARVTFTAFVKAHGEREGVKQTIINRVKITD